MKNGFLIGGLAGWVSCFSSFVFASDLPYTFGSPTYTGRGCPPGSFSYVHNPSDQTLSVLFDSYKVEVGEGRTEDVKDCVAFIPINFRSRVKLSVMQADFRGYRYLPMGAKGGISVSFSFSSMKHLRSGRKVEFDGPANDEFTESIKQGLKSGCGGSDSLRIEMRAAVSTNSSREQAFLQLDSKDLSEMPLSLNKEKKKRPHRPSHQYFLKVHPCKE